MINSAQTVIGNSSISLQFTPGSASTFAYSVYGTKLTGKRDIGSGNYTLIVDSIKGALRDAGVRLRRHACVASG